MAELPRQSEAGNVETFVRWARAVVETGEPIGTHAEAGLHELERAFDVARAAGVVPRGALVEVECSIAVTLHVVELRALDPAAPLPLRVKHDVALTVHVRTEVEARGR
jgi:hypothetical protein